MKKKNFTKRYKGQEAVESHDHPKFEQEWYREDSRENNTKIDEPRQKRMATQLT